MFTVQALYDFSNAVIQEQNQKQKQEDEPLFKTQNQQQSLKRPRDKEHDQILKEDQINKKNNQEKIEKKQNNNSQNQYLTFKASQKILVQKTFQNGWWYGSVIGKSSIKGFFPSNFVKTGAKPPPPPSKKQEQEQQQQQIQQNELDAEWINKKINQVQKDGKNGISSEYYQGIKSYKYVKIGDNNKGVLNANYVKYDVNTGLAKVPVKDQAPAAKAVRQMGYYFDIHQWNEQKNRNPEAFKALPDKSKKKKKKLHLIGFNKQGQHGYQNKFK